MNKRNILIILLLSSVALWAQDEGDFSVFENDDKDDFQTIVGSGTVGGYGALSVGYTQIDNRDALIFGARGGVILGHVFTMGFGGAGFINDYKYDANYGLDASLAGGYGGVFFEFTALPKYPVHISTPLLVGVGGVAYTLWEDYNDDYYHDNYIEDSEVFMVVEPGVELEFNFTRFFRFSIYGNYRFTSNISLENTPSDALEGYAMGITLKFGKF